MKKSKTIHKRGSGSVRKTTDKVIARHCGGSYSVLRRVPQVYGDPEHAVCRGESIGEIIALFFDAETAAEYCESQNARRATK